MAPQQKKEKAMMKTRYENRKTSILKKGKELSTLCDVKVCLILVSPDGKLETWPKNLNDVEAVLGAVKGSGKPIRSEHPRKKRGGGNLGSSSRIKIPKIVTANDDVVADDVKGKEIAVVIGQEICVVGEGRPETSFDVSGTSYDVDDTDGFMINNIESLYQGKEIADVIGQEICIGNAGTSYDVSGTSYDVDDRAIESLYQEPSFHYGNHYYHQWNGNGDENFGNCIPDMVAYQDPNLGYPCGGGYAMNPETNISNMAPNQEPSLYHQYEIGSGSSSAMNSTGIINFSNMVQSNQESSFVHAWGRYEIGSNNFCNMVQSNQESSVPHAWGRYQQ